MMRYLFTASFSRFDVLTILGAMPLLRHHLWLELIAFLAVALAISVTCELDLIVRSRP